MFTLPKLLAGPCLMLYEDWGFREERVGGRVIGCYAAVELM